jgi:hypothetical protein
MQACSKATEYHGDLNGPLPSSGGELGKDILDLLGEDAGLYDLRYHTVCIHDLLVCVGCE